MEASYGIAAFRSRQQVLAFHEILQEANLEAKVIHTPHEIAIGCGLSVQFRREDYARVYSLYQRHTFPSFVGFYMAQPNGTKLILTSMYKP